MGHGVDQFEVTHDRASPWKRGNGTGKHARQPEGPTGRRKSREQRATH
jgi:hypothetical protein